MIAQLLFSGGMNAAMLAVAGLLFLLFQYGTDDLKAVGLLLLLVILWLIAWVILSDIIWPSIQLADQEGLRPSRLIAINLGLAIASLLIVALAAALVPWRKPSIRWWLGALVSALLSAGLLSGFLLPIFGAEPVMTLSLMAMALVAGAILPVAACRRPN